MLAEQGIFRSQEYAVDYFPASAPNGRVAITFTPFRSKSLVGCGFAGDVLTGNGFDVVAFKGVTDNWYRDCPAAAFNATNTFLATIYPLHTHRVSFGSSMGGYASIVFAKTLGIDVALALSPQFDITAAWDARWSSHIDGPMHTLDPAGVRSNCSYVIVYDPHDKDRLHYGKFAEVIPIQNLVPVRVPYSGHPSGYAMAAAGKFKPFVLKTLNGEIPSGAAMATHSTAHYAFNLAMKCAEVKHLRWADALISRAV